MSHMRHNTSYNDCNHPLTQFVLRHIPDAAENRDQARDIDSAYETAHTACPHSELRRGNNQAKQAFVKTPLESVLVSVSTAVGVIRALQRYHGVGSDKGA